MTLVELVPAVLLAALLAGLLAVAVRRRLLQRGGGTIDLSLRLRPQAAGGGWVLGLGRFQGDDLAWFRVFSLAPGPRRTLSRQTLTVQHQRRPAGGETLALLAGQVVLECQVPSGPVELAMGSSAVTGFLAWLESMAPGARTGGGAQPR